MLLKEKLGETIIINKHSNQIKEVLANQAMVKILGHKEINKIQHGVPKIKNIQKIFNKILRAKLMIIKVRSLIILKIKITKSISN